MLIKKMKQNLVFIVRSAPFERHKHIAPREYCGIDTSHKKLDFGYLAVGEIYGNCKKITLQCFYILTGGHLAGNW